MILIIIQNKDHHKYQALIQILMMIIKTQINSNIQEINHIILKILVLMTLIIDMIQIHLKNKDHH